jgi:hypothetical protein
MSDIPSSGSTPEPRFANCNAEDVFRETSAKIGTPELRTLWMRLQDEIRRQGVGASVTYLGGEFTRLKEDLRRELSNTQTN